MLTRFSQEKKERSTCAVLFVIKALLFFIQTNMWKSSLACLQSHQQSAEGVTPAPLTFTHAPQHLAPPHPSRTTYTCRCCYRCCCCCLFVCLFFYRGHLWNTKGTYQIGFAVDLSDMVCYLSIYITVKEDACSLFEKRIR